MCCSLSAVWVCMDAGMGEGEGQGCVGTGKAHSDSCLLFCSCKTEYKLIHHQIILSDLLIYAAYFAKLRLHWNVRFCVPQFSVNTVSILSCQ